MNLRSQLLHVKLALFMCSLVISDIALASTPLMKSTDLFSLFVRNASCKAALE